MSKTMKLIGVVILIVGLAVGFGGCKKKGTSETIVIKGNLPLSGPIGMFSGRYPLGFRLGIEEASAQYGIDPKIFRLDFEDNQGSSSKAVNIMRKQLTGKPDVYISGTSQMSEAVLPVVSTYKIPHFLVSFEATLTERFPNTFIVLPNFKLEAPLFLKFIFENKAKKVFFFTPNLKAYLYQSDVYILPHLKEKGIDYHRELFDFNQSDFYPLVMKVLEYKPDVVIVSGYAFHLFPIIKLLKQYKVHKMSHIMATLDYIDLMRDSEKRKLISGMAFTSPYCEIPGKVKSFQDWKKRFEERFGVTPTYVDAYGYDTARIIVETYKRFGKVSVEEILKIFPFNGIVGEINLDKNRVLNSTLTIGFFSEEGQVQEWRPQNEE